MKQILLVLIISLYSFVSWSDTTDQKWMNKVEIKKTGDHCIDDKNCF